ncbi:MAG: BMA_0021/BMA_0022 family TOMM bacteriocin [Polyangiaceae bacterium]
MPDNSAPFPRLRSAYLRSVAKVWRDPAYLEFLKEQSTGPRGCLPYLEETYNFKFAFDVKLILSDKKRPIWAPDYTTGWYGFGDEYTLFLPAPAKEPEYAAELSAQYYQQFPSLLGAATNEYSVAPPDFAEFGVVTQRILALAWHSKEFHTALYAAEDARGLVQDSMNYIVPWNFSLKFIECPAPFFFAKSDEYWRMFPRSEITLHVPEKPLDLQVEAAALGGYNATGSPYPFTC